ncbi:hypothetical protein Droror1_Dr00018142 [Drosera rotundifolia]
MWKVSRQPSVIGGSKCRAQMPSWRVGVEVGDHKPPTRNAESDCRADAGWGSVAMELKLRQPTRIADWDPRALELRQPTRIDGRDCRWQMPGAEADWEKPTRNIPIREIRSFHPIPPTVF